MRVVVTGTRGIPGIMGGVETHCEQLFPRVATEGADVTVIRRSSYAGDGLETWKGVHLVDIKAPRRKSLEAIVHTFKAINHAVELKADIVHIHAVGPALLVPYAKLRGFKVVFTHHGPDYDRDKWGKAAKFMLRMGERFGCKWADHVIVISDVIRNLVRDKYGRTDNVSLVYNGVPEPNLCDFDEYFDELGIEKGKYILGMCRFVPEKRLHDLIEAYSGLKKVGAIPSDIRLVLAGDTDFEDDYSRGLKDMALREGAALTGFVKGRRLSSLLTNCNCYVLPSSHEGLPIALLEAMSYKARVLVSDIPANLEIGLPAESYFHCGDVGELSSKLQSVCSQAPSKVSYDMSRYDWDNLAKAVFGIYSSLSGSVD